MFPINKYPKISSSPAKVVSVKPRPQPQRRLLWLTAAKKSCWLTPTPASNLGEVLGLPLSAEPAQVPGVTGLFAANVDPVEAACCGENRVVAARPEQVPVRGLSTRSQGRCR